MTGQEIIAKLKELEEQDKYRGYHEFSELAYSCNQPGEMQDIFGKVTEVASYGGEDQGSTYYTILHFVDHNVYIRLDGYYSSYEGVDYSYSDGYQEVTPKEKVVTVFE